MSLDCGSRFPLVGVRPDQRATSHKDEMSPARGSGDATFCSWILGFADCGASAQLGLSGAGVRASRVVRFVDEPTLLVVGRLSHGKEAEVTILRVCGIGSRLPVFPPASFDVFRLRGDGDPGRESGSRITLQSKLAWSYVT